MDFNKEQTETILANLQKAGLVTSYEVHEDGSVSVIPPLIESGERIVFGKKDPNHGPLVHR